MRSSDTLTVRPKQVLRRGENERLEQFRQWRTTGTESLRSIS